ncbi:protein ALP1-like [Chenopodium quinoa]|uniref:protein ALP1-like n=1 Tax=Chenopodium quinoa TaxID=63459 RepID=UPI000B789604|nr:protein ALP1-like [Chenopodium quinoa]
MEISSFPFDDLSQYYPTPYPEIAANSPVDSSPLKKQRSESESVDFFLNNTDTGTIKDILASVLIFGDEDDQNHSHSHSGMEMVPENYNFTLTNNNNENPIQNQNHEIQSAEAEVAVVATAAQPKRGLKRSRNVGQSSTPAPAPVVNRRMWVKDRSKDWWDKCSHPDYPDEEFKKSFRMSKATFNMLCDELDPLINKKDTMLRAAIPVRHRVAVCIWRLATGEPLREVSKRFGLGISTCHKLVLEVCTAIRNTLMARFLQWPDDTKLDAIKEEFKSKTGIPNVGGAIYTTHIPVIAPKANIGVYFNKRHTERNQKTSYTVTLQGMVDPSGIFTDVCIGWPGSFSDEHVLEKSALFKRASRGLMKDMWMVGNSSYPLMDWVLVPYSHQNLTWAQHAFNEKVGEIQKVAKDSFYRLKKRWGCLQKRTEVKLQELPIVLGACCVLHNICEMRKDEIVGDPGNSFELFDDEVLPENVAKSLTAVQARDQIAHHLLHHGFGGNTFL